MRKFFSALTLSMVIVAALSARNFAAQSNTQSQHGASAQTQDVTQNKAAQKDEAATTTTLNSQSATGKITAVSGDTFAIEVGDGTSKETMQFVTDSNTAKSGDLKVGSNANVQYHSGQDGKNTATKVDIQG